MKFKRIFANRNIFIAATIFFVVWVVFFDRNNMLDSLELDRKIEELETEKRYYLERIREDSAVIMGLSDSAYVERFARENFLMRRSNETLYLIEE